MGRGVLRRGRVAAAVLVAVLASGGGLSGCASDAGLEKGEFLARANAVCQQGSTQWDTLVKKLPAEPVTTREKYVVDKLAPALAGIVNQLRSVGYPAGDQEYLDSIYADADKVAAKMVDQPSTNLQETLDAPFAEPAPRFETYGLDRCAKL
jgi:hypothetical protein